MFRFGSPTLSSKGSIHHQMAISFGLKLTWWGAGYKNLDPSVTAICPLGGLGASSRNHEVCTVSPREGHTPLPMKSKLAKLRALGWDPAR